MPYFQFAPLSLGPAKTPEGLASGSFGPTTAGRMDGYVDSFMRNGGSFVTLAKGNRRERSLLLCRNLIRSGRYRMGFVDGFVDRFVDGFM